MWTASFFILSGPKGNAGMRLDHPGQHWTRFLSQHLYKGLYCTLYYTLYYYTIIIKKKLSILSSPSKRLVFKVSEWTASDFYPVHILSRWINAVQCWKQAGQDVTDANRPGQHINS